MYFLYISGLFKDFLGSYDMAFYFGSFGIIAGGMMMAAGNVWLYRQKKKSAELTKHEENGKASVA